MKCTKCGAELKAGEQFCGECGSPRQGSTGQTDVKPSGTSENTKGALCYLFGWITGLIFLLIEKDSKFVRFHAIQSIIINFVLMVVFFAVTPQSSYDDYTLYTLIALLSVILWILLMYKAYKGEKYKLPVIGDFAENKA